MSVSVACSVLAAESPEYALPTCTEHAELVERRNAFVGKLDRMLASFHAPLHPAFDALPFPRSLLPASPNSAQEMAKITVRSLTCPLVLKPCGPGRSL